MAKVIFGNHSSVIVPRQDRDSIRKFHLYFQAPRGQVLRLVGIDEDLSFYEGAGEGPNVARVKEALRRMA